MAIFTLDIERLVKRYQEEGKDLKAIASIQYPIYTLHCEILDSSPSPLDTLDKSIAKLIDEITFDQTEIASILGVPMSGVKNRLEYFNTYEYLDQQGKSLSQLGKNELFYSTEKKLKRKSFDFLIDGVTLNPLPNDFYSKLYKHVIIEEFEYSFHTREDGSTISTYDFAPSVVHTAMDVDIIQKKLKGINLVDRKSYHIPVGLESIENLSFEKCTFPLLVAIYDHPTGYGKELLDGFKLDGASDHLQVFEETLRERIKKLELRLLIKSEKQTNEFKDFDFLTNWNEIDIETEEKKLFWISKEDLLTAFQEHYKLKNLSLDNIISDSNDIGLNVTKELLKNAEQRRLIINNVKRGRDYEMTMKFKRTGVWVTFFSFKTQDAFVQDCLEIIEILDKVKRSKLEVSDIHYKLKEYESYRDILIFLEEFEILESIDIDSHMTQKK
jgi:hypothetical protein